MQVNSVEKTDGAAATHLPERPLGLRLSASRTAVLVGGILISAGAAWLAFRGVDLDELKPVLGRVNWPLLVTGGLVVMLANFLRAVRWRVLLITSSGRARHVDLLSITMIGYLANVALPLRGGDLLRVFMAKWRVGTSASEAAASVISERLLDIVTLAIILGIMGIGVALPSYMYPLFLIVGAGGLAVLAGLVVASIYETPLLSFIGRIQSRWPSPVVVKTTGTAVLFVRGLSPMKRRRTAANAIALSFAVRVAEVVSIMLALWAVDISLPARGYVLLNSVVTLGLLVPSGPGAIGSFELLSVVTITAFGLSRAAALGGALIMHAMGIGVTVAFGSLFAWREAALLRQARAEIRSASAAAGK